MQEEIIDNYGKLPKSVELLFEKKKLDIMLNEKHVESFKEYKQEIEIEFTKEWSDHIDGIKLFETATTISKDIKIRYTNQKISVKIPKGKNTYLSTLIEFISATEKM